MKYTFQKSETLYQGWYRVDRHHITHDRFDGGVNGPFTREVFDSCRNIAGVLLFDPKLDKVVMVEQFRTAPALHNENPWLLEILLGMVDGPESPAEAVRREAEEEAKCTITDLLSICDYYASPGSTSERMHLFVGRITAPSEPILAGLASEHEDIRVHVLDAAKAISLIGRNAVRDAQTLVALQWFAMHHTELRSRWMVSDVGAPMI